MMSPPAEVYDPPRHRASTGEVLGNGMVLTAAGQPLQAQKLIWRTPRSGLVLLKIHACGVCRTDVHVVDGELPHPKLPLVPGHEVIAMVAAVGTVSNGSALATAWGCLLPDVRFCFAIPSNYSNEAAAPLMCAGLIAYRALCTAGDGNFRQAARLDQSECHSGSRRKGNVESN